MIIEINTEAKEVIIKSEFLLDDLMNLIQKFGIWDYKIKPCNSNCYYEPWVINPWTSGIMYCSNTGTVTADQFQFHGQDEDGL